MTGQQARTEECPVVRENGKHVMIGSEQRAGYKFWVKRCNSCGWVDTEDIERQVLPQLLEEIIEDLQTIYNTRKKNRESSADVVQVLSKYRHKLRELEDK